jgi:glutamate---cysteine ligase / carboxylate-amine ligase
MTDYRDFVRSTAELARVAEVPDYTYHWWKLRPHPRLGTVEIRALDTQLAPAHTAAIVATVHALARHLAGADQVGDPPPEILDEASFRAARDGVHATLPDDEGRLRPVDELARELVELVRPAARELGGERELAGLERLLADGGGAAIQRAAHAADGMTGVLAATRGAVPRRQSAVR